MLLPQHRHQCLHHHPTNILTLTVAHAWCVSCYLEHIQITRYKTHVSHRVQYKYTALACESIRHTQHPSSMVIINTRRVENQNKTQWCVQRVLKCIMHHIQSATVPSAHTTLPIISYSTLWRRSLVAHHLTARGSTKANCTAQRRWSRVALLGACFAFLGLFCRLNTTSV